MELILTARAEPEAKVGAPVNREPRFRRARLDDGAADDGMRAALTRARRAAIRREDMMFLGFAKLSFLGDDDGDGG